MRVSDASNVLGKLQRMSEQGPQAVDATVRVLAERIVEEAVGNMPKGGVSAPGEAPHQQSGELAQSIKSIVRRRGEKTKGKVGTSLVKGYFLEFGRSNMAARPWLFPAFERVSEQGVEVLREQAEAAL